MAIFEITKREESIINALRLAENRKPLTPVNPQRKTKTTSKASKAKSDDLGNGAALQAALERHMSTQKVHTNVYDIVDDKLIITTTGGYKRWPASKASVQKWLKAQHQTPDASGYVHIKTRKKKHYIVMDFVVFASTPKGKKWLAS